ncbi:MAG TPA: CDP-alcohol phosphatidyltransferase family protein [Candidatus Dormibacteraeota bacterium]|nr:CDP-alcohol phosphatidyltransferase family protein [Candidatus Dormibacteraeota bacterium]
MGTGPANLVTGSRVLLSAPAFWLAAGAGGGTGRSGSASFWWLVLIVVAAGLTDLLDGWVARRFDRPTRFGAAFDPVADGFFFGAVALGLAAGGAYPAWLAWVVVLRYLLPVLVGAVLVARRRLPSLRHTFFGQLSTAMIAVLLGGVALLRGLGLPGSSLVAVAGVVVPAVTILAWLELAWTARRLAAPDASPTPAS